MVAPSSASWWAAERWNTVSSASAVSRLATIAARMPPWTWRRRSDAPILARNVISAPTIRIASSPSRSMITKDWTNRLVLESPAPSAAAARSKSGGEPLARGVELGARAGARGGAKGREVGLQLGREGRVAPAQLALDLLEGHVGVERAGGCARVAGPREGVDGVHLRAHDPEDLTGRRAGALRGPDRGQAREPAPGAIARRGQRVEQLGVGHLAGAGEVPEARRRLAGRRWQAQGAGIEGDRPALPSREPVLERRHRGADDADVDAPVVVQRRLVVERTPVGEIGRRRIQTLGQLAVAAPEVTMAAGTARPVHLGAEREVGRPAGQLVQGHAEPVGECAVEGAHPGIEAVGRAQSLYQRQERVHGGDRVELGTGGQRRGGATGLLEEEAGLLDLGRGHDATLGHSDAVLLGGESGGGGDPADDGGRILGSGGRDGSERRQQDRQCHADESHFHPVSEEAGLN